jgi:hypothetical protein
VKIGRLQAFAIHLLISLAVFAALLGAMWLWFFPGALFAAAGGWQGVQIIALVDLVLGPCLTLIVFNRRKPAAELRRDLTLIGLMQVVALAGGVYAAHLVRPLAVVQVFDTLYVHNQESFSSKGLNLEAQKRLTGWLPRFYYVPVPGTPEEFLQQHIKDVLNGATPLQERYDLFQPMLGASEQLGALLRAGSKEMDGCLRVDIESAYTKGSVCVDTQRMRLYDFIETQ